MLLLLFVALVRPSLIGSNAKTTSFTGVYIGCGVAVVVTGAIIILLVIRHKKNNNANMAENNVYSISIGKTINILITLPIGYFNTPVYINR